MQANGEGWGPWEWTITPRGGTYLRRTRKRPGEAVEVEPLTAEYANRLEATARRAEGLEQKLTEAEMLIRKANTYLGNSPSKDPPQWKLDSQLIDEQNAWLAALSEKGD